MVPRVGYFSLLGEELFSIFEPYTLKNSPVWFEVDFMPLKWFVFTILLVAAKKIEFFGFLLHLALRVQECACWCAV